MFLPYTYTVRAGPWSTGSGTLATHSQNFGFQRPELQEKEMNGQHQIMVLDIKLKAVDCLELKIYVISSSLEA